VGRFRYQGEDQLPLRSLIAWETSAVTRVSFDDSVTSLSPKEAIAEFGALIWIKEETSQGQAKRSFTMNVPLLKIKFPFTAEVSENSIRNPLWSPQLAKYHLNQWILNAGFWCLGVFSPGSLGRSNVHSEIINFIETIWTFLGERT
jgi:hypothetical protein